MPGIYRAKHFICMYVGPKLSDNTQAALKAFNAYRPQLQVLDADEVGDQLISYELISGGTLSGDAIHLPNQVKMDLILPQIEQKISLGGPEMFFKLITALSVLPSSYELSTQLKSMYICVYVCIVYTFQYIK